MTPFYPICHFHKHSYLPGFEGSLILVTKSDAYMQVIGWSMWFSEFLFLERSWAKDESTIKVLVNMLYAHIHVWTHYNWDIHSHIHACIFTWSRIFAFKVKMELQEGFIFILLFDSLRNLERKQCFDKPEINMRM